MLYCPECGTPNEDQALVCQSCARPLPKLPPAEELAPAPPLAAPPLFCPFCGRQNLAQAQNCAACGAALPRLEALPQAAEALRPTPLTHPSAPPLPFTPQAEAPLSWWQRLTPDFRAALITGVIVTGLQVLSDVVPGLGFVFSSPFAIASYYLQGVLTGKLLKDDPARRHATLAEYAWRGALSGVWTSVVFSTVLTLLMLLITVPLSAGALLLAIPIIVVNSLVDIVLNVAFAALGAWLYGRLGGRRMAAVSAGVMGCGVVLACLLSLLALFILSALGIGLWQGLAAGYGQ